MVNLILMMMFNGAGGRRSDSYCLIGIGMLFAGLIVLEMTRLYFQTKRARG